MSSYHHITLSSHVTLSPCQPVIFALSIILLVLMSSCSLIIVYASTNNSIACDGCHLCQWHFPTFSQAIILALHVIVSIWSASCHDPQNITRTWVDHTAVLSYLEAILWSSWGHFAVIVGLFGAVKNVSSHSGIQKLFLGVNYSRLRAILGPSWRLSGPSWGHHIII